MACDDVAPPIDQQRIRKTELFDAPDDLVDLSRAMGPAVPRVRGQIRASFVGDGQHTPPPSNSANAKKRGRARSSGKAPRLLWPPPHFFVRTCLSRTVFSLWQVLQID